jgi:hypothetical protein
VDDTLWLLAHIAVSLLLVLVTVIATLGILGPRLRRHAVWLERLDLRVGNLHKEREAAYVRSLQIRADARDDLSGVSPMHAAAHTPRPPTLSGAPTTEVTPDMLERLTARMRPPSKPE